MAFFVDSDLKTTVGELDITVNESTDFNMLALEAAIEIERIDASFMEGIGKYEVKSLYESGEVVYTEGMLDTIKSKLSKIWEFIKKWVKSVWNKFVAWMSSFIRGDKEFISKYKKQIEENVTYLDKDFEIDSKYNAAILFDGSDTFKELKDRKDLTVSVFTSQAEKLWKTDKDKLSDLLEEADGNMEEFYDAIKDTMEDTSTITSSWIKSNIQLIMDCVKEDTSKYQRKSDSEVKVLDRIAKALENGAKSLKDGASQDAKNEINAKINAIRSLSKKFSTHFSKITSLEITCLKYRKSLSRAICRKVLTAKPNPKYNESSVFDTNDFESFFKI